MSWITSMIAVDIVDEFGYIITGKPAEPLLDAKPECLIPAGVSFYGPIFYLFAKIAPQSQWSTRLLKLLEDYPDVPLRIMGFPENWKECPI
ncbi:MAG: hypothetical protein A2268_05875 [Candidatus Raymondbacteria bacterium RifOxyA12_full_50_37]|uniref:Uncharacterized protein n=1 Tax=Candidatus Raymondbacteria bacterium RIFOXYD12_FULL_49_13 TaxID=1817890 RepID=A0A1F7FG29_UNCRA|nr:MAG: hypothetical protein A2268_05875 [Candidatus Raymondbacteria bacterium RifOxyA12_full_50_37]OGJ94268.1 MAG: hypothetical protein A2248_14805 [Candidatus Raymondbacteria bacterium RIFOXYA2_FULL_49_16]OGJ96381.1 MAG: hypothetical protein A2487_00405 [Candidatus Raymondbacteria bacterium RifOxyC12_full_50_8]OGJ99098.1 MAG: hypothetical protein A2453_11215 [Candidatus Raymondbacteria bacterium RIFOXYC2_FULL_50_21]OGK01196.1 MAG: hypothetical protein A2350_01695 [Candidatus Raymondbacteria b